MLFNNVYKFWAELHYFIFGGGSVWIIPFTERNKNEKVAKSLSAKILNHCKLLHTYLITETLWVNVEWRENS